MRKRAIFLGLCMVLFAGFVQISSAGQIDNRFRILSYLSHADSLFYTYQYDSAKTCYQIAADSAVAVFGETDSLYFEAMKQIALCYDQQEKYDSSEIVYTPIHEKILSTYGSESLEAAQSYFMKGYFGSPGKGAEKIKNFRIAKDKLEKIYHPGHPTLSKVYAMLGAFVSYHEDYQAGIDLIDSAITILEAQPVQDTSNLIESYCYYCFSSNELPIKTKKRLLTKALKMSEQQEYINPQILILLYGEIARCYLSSLTNNFSDVEKYYNKALELCEQTSGKHSSTYLEILSSMLMNLSSIWSHDKTIRYYNLANSIVEEAGTTSLLKKSIATLKYYQGGFYRELGRHEIAKDCFWKSYEYLKYADGSISSNSLWPLSNYCFELYSLNEYKEALSILHEAERDYHKLGITDLPLILQLKYMTAISLFQLGEAAKADSIFYEVENLLIGLKEIDLNKYIGILGWLGDFNRQRGQYEKAEINWQEALNLDSKSLPANHPSLSVEYISLAAIYASTGRNELAVEYFLKTLRARHSYLTNVFRYCSEDEKFAFLKKYRLINEPLLSMALKTNLPSAKMATFETLLKGKGLVLDILSAEKKSLSCSGDSTIMQIVSEHKQVCEQLSSMAFQRNADSTALLIFDSLVNSKNEIESILSESCGELKQRYLTSDYTPSKALDAIPPNHVLLDFIKYRPYDLYKPGRDDDRFSDKHYLVVMVTDQKEIILKDLGLASTIDSLILDAREYLYVSPVKAYREGKEQETELKQITEELYGLLLEPLTDYFGTSYKIIVSPDGPLNFLPFEILTAPDGTYAIEKYQFSYITSSRELLERPSEMEKNRSAILIGNPEFSFTGIDTKDPAKLFREQPTQFTATLPNNLRGESGCLNHNYSSLPYSIRELNLIEGLIKKKSDISIRRYEGIQATESILKDLTSPPAILHLATHGFVCSDENSSNWLKRQDNPLLYSGLLFAGANTTLQSTDEPVSGNDGILTSLEVSSLNLHGTDLVVLSACETGLGELLYAEGVAGLRRAFQEAGCNSIMMSLWKVPDQETSEFMKLFYENWLSGKPKAEALRDASLEMMRIAKQKYEHTHPFLWSGFVLYGAEQ